MEEFGYGLAVVGPSGSGKSTFCAGLEQFFSAIHRDFVIVNMDPANETMNYTPSIDIKDLIQLEEVMKELNLGPNGALRYCMSFIAENLDWLLSKFKGKNGSYVIFDFPGQIELYLNDENLGKILKKIQKNDLFCISLTTVALFDSICCYEASQYLSTSILSLMTQIHLETPHINVLTKIDLLKELGKLPYRLSMYFENDALELFVEELENDQSLFGKKYHKLTQKLREVIVSENLVSFFPLYLTDKLSVCRLVALIDKANGFFYFKENSKKKFADLRDAVFSFDELDHEEMMMSLEEEILDHYDNLPQNPNFS